MFSKSDFNAIFLGVRKTDPEGKDLTFFKDTTKGWPKATRVFPILNWDYSDIWEYLDKLNIPTCSLYERGYTSIGTIKDSFPNSDLYDPVSKTYRPARELRDPKDERKGREKK